MKFRVYKSGVVEKFVDFVGGLGEPEIHLSPISGCEVETSDVSASDMLGVIKQMRERFGEEFKPSIVCRTQAGEVEHLAIASVTIFGVQNYQYVCGDRGTLVFVVQSDAKESEDAGASVWSPLKPQLWAKDDDDPVLVEGREALAAELFALWLAKDDAAVSARMVALYGDILK